MPDRDESIPHAHRHWEQGPLADALARHPERGESFATGSGVPVSVW